MLGVDSLILMFEMFHYRIEEIEERKRNLDKNLDNLRTVEKQGRHDGDL